MKRVAAVPALLALALSTSALAGPATSSTPELPLERTYSVAPSALLDLSVDAADVSVTGGTGSEIRVVVSLRPKGTAERVEWNEIETSRDVVRIEIRDRDANTRNVWTAITDAVHGRAHESPISHVRVELPASGSLELGSGAGDVDVRNVSGRVHVETGAGDVGARQLSGQVQVETGAGDVDVEAGGESLRIETGAGDVEARVTAGAVRIETGAGDVDVDVEQLTASVEIETGAGDCAIQIRAGGFDLDAESGGGDLRLVTGGRTHAPAEDHEALRATVGDGGPTLRIRSGAGDVTVKANEAAATLERSRSM